MKAFFDLASDRQDGGRIPWSTVRAWCEAHGLDGDDAEDVHFILTRMDMAYMEWAKAKGKKLSEERKRAEEAKDAHTKGVR